MRFFARVYLTEVIPSRAIGLNALHAEVMVESVARDRSGRRTIAVRGSDSQLYTLVGDGEQWTTK